jgi:hypothetical protein
MNPCRPRLPMSDQAKHGLDDLGAEPLKGSGFEGETPEPEAGAKGPTEDRRDGSKGVQHLP